MFTYAITRAVAEKNNYQWGFNPIPEYDNGRYNGIAQFDFMEIDYGEIHNYKRDENPPFIKYFWYEKVEEKNYSNGDFVRYFPYQPEVFDIPDDTKLYVANCQNILYYESIKDQIQNWFKVKEENIEKYNNKLKKLNIILDENLCLIHVRGGDFLGDKRILLPKEYYQNAINIMKGKNSKMRFVVLTDDVEYGKLLFDEEIIVLKNELGCDYFIINNSKNIILSNSSFSLFPTWLNNTSPYVIAPRYWWRYNISSGYWASSDIAGFKFNFLDKNGELYDK
jgi:hypothetical protein